jgi:small subunit ribosomal protein S12
MPTSVQLGRYPRRRFRKRRKTVALRRRPQRKGVCLRVLTMSPKKPNSASRKIAKIRFYKPYAKITAHIPGIGHNIQKHSQVLVRGGRAKDLPGVNYRLIRGKYDLSPIVLRRKSRSKYGMKKFSNKKNNLKLKTLRVPVAPKKIQKT